MVPKSQKNVLLEGSLEEILQRLPEPLRPYAVQVLKTLYEEGDRAAIILVLERDGSIGALALQNPGLDEDRQRDFAPFMAALCEGARAGM